MHSLCTRQEHIGFDHIVLKSMLCTGEVQVHVHVHMYMYSCTSMHTAVHSRFLCPTQIHQGVGSGVRGSVPESGQTHEALSAGPQSPGSR